MARPNCSRRKEIQSVDAQFAALFLNFKLINALVEVNSVLVQQKKRKKALRDKQAVPRGYSKGFKAGNGGEAPT